MLPKRKWLFDGTIPSNKKLFDGTVPSNKKLYDGTPKKGRVGGGTWEGRGGRARKGAGEGLVATIEKEHVAPRGG